VFDFPALILNAFKLVFTLIRPSVYLKYYVSYNWIFKRLSMYLIMVENISSSQIFNLPRSMEHKTLSGAYYADKCGSDFGMLMSII